MSVVLYVAVFCGGELSQVWFHLGPFAVSSRPILGTPERCVPPSCRVDLTKKLREFKDADPSTRFFLPQAVQRSIYKHPRCYKNWKVEKVMG